jgi:hypothetical protein
LQTSVDSTTNFIVNLRAFEEALYLGKLVVALFCVHFLLQAPYLIMNYLVLIVNSTQVLHGRTPYQSWWMGSGVPVRDEGGAGFCFSNCLKLLRAGLTTHAL